MGEIVHTPTCIEATKRLNEYRVQWPNYCKNCGGRGVVEYVDFVDYGSTTVSMPSEDYCEKCLGEMLCPRCAKSISSALIDSDGPDAIDCTHCNWTEDTPGAPDYECECYLYSIDDTDSILADELITDY